MKHRFTIPYADDPEDVQRLDEWVYRHGWRVERQEWLVHRFGGGNAFLWVTLAPLRSPSIPEGAKVTVCSGATLIYDDVEQSMGVTLLAEPRDAIPPQPEDARPT